MEEITLKSGIRMPVIGLGTWKLTGSRCTDAVNKAVRMGYSHIDTADAYGNHEDIGKAISSMDRRKLFITSKLWRDSLRHDDAIASCDRFLKELKTSHIDMLLIHWPNKDVPIEETLSAMRVLQEAGKIRGIGVSNFTVRHLKEALETGVQISVNQVEFHPYLNQESLLAFCKENGIAVTAYSPLARGRILGDDIVKGLAEKHGKTPAQVSLRWLVQKGIICIPKASSEEHMMENLRVFGWELDRNDMKALDSLDRGERLINPGFSEF